MNLTFADTPTPLVDWRPSTEPDRAAHGYHYGREIFIDHVPDDKGIAVWRIRVHYGTNYVECERIHRGNLEDAKELAAWIACDLSRRDNDGLITAVRLGYCILNCSLTHCSIIDPAGRQWDNVLIGCAYKLIERLMQDPESARSIEHWQASREQAMKYVTERRERREHANGSPAPTEHYAVGPAKEPA